MRADGHGLKCVKRLLALSAFPERANRRVGSATGTRKALAARQFLQQDHGPRTLESTPAAEQDVGGHDQGPRGVHPQSQTDQSGRAQKSNNSGHVKAARPPHEEPKHAAKDLAAIERVDRKNVEDEHGNGSPAADTPPPLITYDARVHVRSAHQERIIPLREFHTGPGNRAGARRDHHRRRVRRRPRRPGERVPEATRVASDISKVTCAVALQRDGDVCTYCRVALGAVGPTPMRSGSAEAALQGRTIDAAWWKSAPASSSRTSPQSTTSGVPRCTAGRRPACSSRTPSTQHGSVRDADELHQCHHPHGERR